MSVSVIGDRFQCASIDQSIMHNRGVWNPTFNYLVSDTVADLSGNTWVAQAPNSNQDPQTASPSPWSLLGVVNSATQDPTFDIVSCSQLNVSKKFVNTGSGIPSGATTIASLRVEVDPSGNETTMGAYTYQVGSNGTGFAVGEAQNTYLIDATGTSRSLSADYYNTGLREYFHDVQVDMSLNVLGNLNCDENVAVGGDLSVAGDFNLPWTAGVLNVLTPPEITGIYQLLTKTYSVPTGKTLAVQVSMSSPSFTTTSGFNPASDGVIVQILSSTPEGSIRSLYTFEDASNWTPSSSGNKIQVNNLDAILLLDSTSNTLTIDIDCSDDVSAPSQTITVAIIPLNESVFTSS